MHDMLTACWLVKEAVGPGDVCSKCSAQCLDQAAFRLGSCRASRPTCDDGCGCSSQAPTRGGSSCHPTTMQTPLCRAAARLSRTRLSWCVREAQFLAPAWRSFLVPVTDVLACAHTWQNVDRALRNVQICPSTLRLACRTCHAPSPPTAGCRARRGRAPCAMCCVLLRTTTRASASELHALWEVRAAGQMVLATWQAAPGCLGAKVCTPPGKPGLGWQRQTGPAPARAARSCQSMNYVAAMLLLVLGRDEEDAFWVLASLIDDNDDGARAWRATQARRQLECQPRAALPPAQPSLQTPGAALACRHPVQGHVRQQPERHTRGDAQPARAGAAQAAAPGGAHAGAGLRHVHPGDRQGAGRPSAGCNGGLLRSSGLHHLRIIELLLKVPSPLSRLCRLVPLPILYQPASGDGCTGMGCAPQRGAKGGHVGTRGPPTSGWFCLDTSVFLAGLPLFSRVPELSVSDLHVWKCHLCPPRCQRGLTWRCFAFEPDFCTLAPRRCRSSSAWRWPCSSCMSRCCWRRTMRGSCCVRRAAWQQRLLIATRS